MINCTVLKLLGDFNIAKNPSIITKSFCSGTDAGLGEIGSMTRIKEQPSYMEKWGLHGYIFFSFLHQNNDCGYTLEPSLRGGSNVYSQLIYLLSKDKKNINIFN